MLSEPVSPLLPSEEVEFLRQFSAAEVCNRYQDNLAIDVSKYFHGIEAVHLCRGRQSGLEFFWPSLGAALPELYGAVAAMPHYYSQAKWEFTEALEQLRDYHTVLDVGCGEGAFLAHLKEAGHAAFGIDVSPTAVHRARQQGLHAHVASVADLQDSLNKLPLFDAVTAFQVLEHVDSPMRFLEGVIESIRDGGLLIVAVPDGGGAIASLDVPLDLPPHHMTRWNLAALQFLCSQLPLQLHAYRHEPLAIEHIPLLARACFRPLHEPAAWWARFRNRMAAAVASRYWRLCHDQIVIRGHTLLVSYRVLRRQEAAA